MRIKSTIIIVPDLAIDFTVRSFSGKSENDCKIFIRNNIVKSNMPEINNILIR